MSPDLPICFGHRGAVGYGHENTIEAFRMALAMRATGLESDAWLAGDGVPVLVHDRTLRRPGRRISVIRQTSAELGEWGVPTLAELYHACGTRFALSLDIKSASVVGPLLAVARAADAVDRLWLCHEELDLLAHVRLLDPRVHLIHSIEPRGIRTAFGVHLDRLADIGVEVLNMRWRGWSAERVDAVHDRRLRAFAWDVPDAAAIDHMLDLGLDGIYSDYPDRLVRAVAAWRGSRR